MIDLSAEAKPRNLVALCDGTRNHLGDDLTNIARLFRCLDRDATQQVFYNSGVGTIGGDMWWSQRARSVKALFEQATGYAIDRDILAIYRFICANYQDGDRIWLFGFSRGAYTVRIVAALLHMVGVLPKDQIELSGYALSYLKAISERDGEADKADFDRVYGFARIAGARRVSIWFLGLFDTVSSLILPERNGPFPGLATLPCTRKNKSVRVVRHAAAIDERRALFRLNRWTEPQPFVPNPFRPEIEEPQDVKQVWFAGVHADIGGGYPEAKSSLAKVPLLWMIQEAQAHGLRLSHRRIDRFVRGERADDNGRFVKPSFNGDLHDSMPGHGFFEYIPKARDFAETRKPIWPLYLPLAEPRALTRTSPRPRVHQGVFDRIAAGGYIPVNLPTAVEVEPW
ncbi:DUF2235 domain-containing protein [Bosea sp. ASV33]|uniref:DUF2235 domain-containing protein n=1 Tax=Bosea sp. ASV33 TaxID=2795106 RepID=UPI0018EB4643|nr:DUF2235 domain-containing protein [Bosea sp. ASV33]